MDWLIPQDEPERLTWGDEWEARLSEAAPNLSPGRRAPLVAALTLYCTRDRAQAPLSEAELDVLVLHTLRHAGEDVAAEAVLSRWPAGRRRRVAAYQAVGGTTGAADAGTARLIAGGCLYPAEEGAGSGPTWTLALDRALRTEDLFLELAWTVRLGDVLRTTAALWNAASGHGRLRIRGLMSLARRMEGTRATARQVRRRADDLRGWIEAWWVRIAAQKGWRRVPAILPLDLVV